ncbi:MAG TPA: rhodanese-like domain-containing protein [Bryobacteraceae bacterium]|nr:rhodanese-like domain-containing protein [Bryobacteraceae bacterium]
MNVSIQHILETHLHADFVSGHLELAQRTGARIYLGEGSGAAFPHTSVRDGDSLAFGSCRFDFLQTPGHTIESVCLVLTDMANPGAPKAVFTGDTLFVGDVGRPDLSPAHTPQQLAALLYRSIHEKLLRLPDTTELFPAHGAGSLCGRQMSNERSSTIGRERQSNYALRAANSEEFVRLLTENLPSRPAYFGRDVELNRHGAASLDSLPHLVPLPAGEVPKLQSEGAVVLDTRPAMEFAVGHVPGSVHIALSGQYASWAARILGLDARLVVVAEDAERVRESRIRLARVGMENIAGYLEKGIAGWSAAGYDLDCIPQVSMQEFSRLQEQEGAHVSVLDVREPAEREAAAIPHSIGIPLGQLRGRLEEVDRDKLVVVHCKGGYRSAIATSLLRRAGFKQVANLAGGFDAWKTMQAG